MSTDKGFFKFQNVQLVQRSTQQNTQLDVQGTAEEQFQNIVSVAEQQALQDIDNAIVDDLLEDSDGPDIADTGIQVSITTSETNISSSNLSSLEVPTNIPETTSESTSSIEVSAPIKDR